MKIICLGFFMAIWCYGQTPMGGVTGGSAPVSNILLVHKTACPAWNGASSACTIPATTAGNALIIVQADADNPAAPGVPTGVTGSTCVTDVTLAQTASDGRTTYFDCPSISAGTTSVNLHVGAGSQHSAAAILEVSGLATSVIMDAAVSAKFSNSSATVLASNTITTTQTDLVVGECTTGLSSVANMAAGAGWSDGLDVPNAGDGTDTYVADIRNGVVGTFAVTMTGDAHNYTCMVVAYKSAVPGSAPSGITTQTYIPFGNTPDGTAVSLANLQSNTYGPGLWSVGNGLTGLSFANAYGHAPLTQTTAQGVTYSASSGRGLSVDLNQVTHPSVVLSWPSLSGTNAVVRFGFAAPNPTVPDQIGMFQLTGVGSPNDYIGSNLVNGNFSAEDSTSTDHGNVPISPGQHVNFCVGFVQNGTYTVSIKDDSGNHLSGSPITFMALHSAAPNSFAVSRQGAEGGQYAQTMGYGPISLIVDNSSTCD